MRSSFFITLGCIVALLFVQPSTLQAQKKASKKTYDFDSVKKLQKPGTGLKIQTPQPKRRSVKVKASSLKKAIDTYRQGNIDQAMMLFDRALQSGKLTKRDRGIAQFFMGKALFTKGLFYGSVPYLHAIVKDSPNEVYYPYSFRRLIWIAKKDKRYDLVTDVMQQKSSVRVPRNYRDDVYMMLARSYFEKGDLKRADWVINKIQAGSEYYFEAQLVRALLSVQQGKYEKAKTLFDTVAQAPNVDLQGLAFLGLGRIAFEQGKDRLAALSYDRISKDSRHWLRGQVEAAWAHFRVNESSSALGNVHPFDTEPFGKFFSPEASIIKSTVFFRLCKFALAESSILTFFERYQPVYRQIEAFNGKYLGNKQKYRSEVLKAIFGESIELPKSLTREIFSRNWFEQRLAQLRGLKAEEARIAKMGAFSKTRSAAFAKKYLKNMQDEITREILDRAVPELVHWEARLQEFFRQASLLRFESAYATIDLEKRNVRSDFEVTKDPEFEVWQFDEEYWRDELGDYRYLLRSECESQ